MFEAEPMTPETLGILRMMADQRGWDVRWAVVTWLVTNYPEGRWLNGGDIVKLNGTNRARETLRHLAEARILDRDGGGSDRRFWYRVNPNWWEWKVRWSHRCKGHAKSPVKTADSCDHCQQAVEQLLSLWEQDAAESPVARFSARGGARYSEISARLGARYSEDRAAQQALDTALARAHARANRTTGGRSDEIARAGARAKTEIARAGARAISPSAVEEEVSSKSREETDTSSSSIGTSVDDQHVIDLGDWGRVQWAVINRCVGPAGGKKGAYLAPKKARELRDLVERYGVNAVIAGAELVEDGVHMVPSFLMQLTMVLAAQPIGPTSEGELAAGEVPEPPRLVILEPEPVPEPTPESTAGQYLQRAAKFATQRTRTG